MEWARAIYSFSAKIRRFILPPKKTNKHKNKKQLLKKKRRKQQNKNKIKNVKKHKKQKKDQKQISKNNICFNGFDSKKVSPAYGFFRNCTPYIGNCQQMYVFLKQGAIFQKNFFSRENVKKNQYFV